MSGQSAIYDDCLSGDIPGVVRGKKGNGSCHIFRFTQIRCGTLPQKDVADILIQIIQAAGVSISPGATALQRIFFLPSWVAIYLVRLMTPALLAPYKVPLHRRSFR